MKLDYNIQEISNEMGHLSTHYPSLLLVPETELQNGQTIVSNGDGQGHDGNNGTSMPTQQQTPSEFIGEPAKLRDCISKARSAR